MNQFHFHTLAVAPSCRDEVGDIILSLCTTPPAASWWPQQTPTRGCKCWSFTLQQRVTYSTTAHTLSFTRRSRTMKFWSVSRDVNLELPTSTTFCVLLLLCSLTICIKTTQPCEQKKCDDHLYRLNRKTLFLMTVWELHLSYVILNPGMGFRPTWVIMKLYSVLRQPGYCSRGLSEHSSELLLQWGCSHIPNGTILFLRETSHLGSHSAKPKSMLSNK